MAVTDSVGTAVACLNVVRESAKKHLPRTYCNHEDLSEAVWRTLLGDRTSTERPAPATYSERSADFMKYLHMSQEAVP